ncbi:MAG: hypothetical protein SGARI_008081 [Bacillariaceae sp.]
MVYEKPNTKAELLKNAPSGTRLQREEQRKEVDLYEKINYLVQQSQEQGQTIAALVDKVEDLQHDNEVKQDEIDSNKKRISELENPRRSKRIAKILGKKNKKNKSSKK